MEIAFTKMVGAGNDFIVIDNRRGELPDGEARRSLLSTWCARRLGVGADGVLLVENDEASAFRMRYYNADGGEAEMCGNGGRCIARFAHINGIAPAQMTFVSMAGRHEAEVRGENVKLGMTEPHGAHLNDTLPLAADTPTVSFLNTGVPHVVEIVGDVETIDVVARGREIRYHERFAPAGTNANFIEPLDRRTFRIRTYERGVEDETLACGTGTTAAAILGCLLGHFDSPVTGITRSGLPLTIHFTCNGEHVSDVFLEGEARVVYTGTLSLP